MDFEDIYRRHFKDVLLFLRGLTGDGHLAEEIAQETFVKALKTIDTFDGTKDIRAWLFTIGRNTYYTHCRRHRRECPMPEEEQTNDIGVSFVKDVENEEQVFLLHRFLHSMEEPYKEVFTLRVMGELPFAKIGILFGKSENWARVTFYRAKSRIAEFMKKQNDV